MNRICFLLLFLSCSGPASGRSQSAALAADDPYAEARAIVGDVNGIVTPGGIQEDFVVELGGARQAVNVRGSDRNNPILLFIHGGPGAVAMPVAWTFQRPWEDYFTVVQWDQRGAGKSYALNDPEELAPTLTPEQYRDDAIELIEVLQRRYDKRKIFLLGHSWGSIVGLSVAASRPDLLHAYIGMGQIIDLREGERVGMSWTIERARRDRNLEAVREIQALSPYPDAGPFTIEQAEAWRKWSIHYGALAAGRDNARFYLRAPSLSPEYTPADRAAWSAGSAFTLETLWPRLADVSFASLRKLDVPVIMLLGRHDHTTPSSIVAEWMIRLEAPKKSTLWFRHSAHFPMIEEPGRVFAALLQQARPIAAH